MKKRQMERWVKALRSGKYKQGRVRLHSLSNNSYCCLGVACDINRRHLLEGYKEDVEIGFYDNEGHCLPESIQSYIGIKSSTGSVEGNLSLIDLNDSGKSFTEIADIIEQNYKRL